MGREEIWKGKRIGREKKKSKKQRKKAGLLPENEEGLRCVWKSESKEKVWDSHLGRMGVTVV